MLSNKEQQIQQLSLLRSYVQTLQKENNAKNHERQILYNQIKNLKQDHQKMLNMIQDKDQQIRNHQIYQQNVQVHIEQLQRKIQLFYFESQQRQNYISEIQENINKLQVRNQQFSTKLIKKQNQQICLRNQIKQLNEELQNMQKQLQQVQSHNSSINVSQLIQNYQKIQIISREREKQNQELKIQNTRLQLIIQQLRQNFQRKDNKNIHLRNASDTTLSYFPQTQQLIIQNNQLIQRITALERQKNILYGELTGKQWIRETSSNFNQHYNTERQVVLKNSTGQHINLSPFKLSNSSNKLQNRIQTLRTQNENLLKSLRLE